MNLWGFYVMSVIYIATGIFHFIKPKMYKSIIPRYLPWPNTIVFLSGLVEIILGSMLLFVSLRTYALWAIIIMLLLFLPVHFYMLTDPKFALRFPKWLLILRIPVQFLLIYWAYIYL